MDRAALFVQELSACLRQPKIAKLDGQKAVRSSSHRDAICCATSVPTSSREMAMPRFDVATDTDSCPECGARFIVAPCRSCKGKGQTRLFLKCKDCDGIGKKMVCPNFLSHLRAQPGSQTSFAKTSPDQ
jgi:RecJ-like exonuclease